MMFLYFCIRRRCPRKVRNEMKVDVPLLKYLVRKFKDCVGWRSYDCSCWKARVVQVCCGLERLAIRADYRERDCVAKMAVRVSALICSRMVKDWP